MSLPRSGKPTAGNRILVAAAGGAPLLMRQHFDADTGTYTYLLADPSTGQGVLIDPVFDQHERDLALIHELGITLVACLDTHVHADHITGNWRMHEATGSAIGLAGVAGAENVTLPLAHGDWVRFGGRHLEVRATPGHTDGCLTYVLDDHTMAFCGDALLVRGCGRCDFQQGNAHTLFRSITQQIFSLPEHCLLYPGHDYTGRDVSSVAEEKAYNARLGGEADERDFVGFMENLQLPHPHRIDEALPANLRCGRPDDDTAAGAEEWAPIERSYAGLPQLNPRWVAEKLQDLRVIDVRSLEEYEGLEGRIPDSLAIPLPELAERLVGLDRESPTVVVCHSGARSALATQQLIKAGFKRVANLRGGLRALDREGLVLEKGSPAD